MKRFITVSPGFFIILVILAQSRLTRPEELLVWLLVATVSVLVHELGHALVARRFGKHPTISLHMMGGTTTYESGEDLSRVKKILITAGGPACGLALGGVVFLVHRWAGASVAIHPLAAQAIQDALWVNIGWSIVNLLPILPLDGGQITAALFGKVPATWISGGTAALLLVVSLVNGNTWGLVLMGWLAIRNGQPIWRKRQEKRDEPLRRDLEHVEALAEKGHHQETLSAARELRNRFHAPWNQYLAADLQLWAAIELDNEEEIGEAMATFPAAYPADHFSSGIANQKLGRLHLAINDFKQALHTDNRVQALNALLSLLASSGQHDTLLKLLDEHPTEDIAAEVLVAIQASLIEADRTQDALHIGELGYAKTEHPYLAYNLACTNARTGETDAALSWLEKALENGFHDAALMRDDADLAPLRNTEIFRRLLERI